MRGFHGRRGREAGLCGLSCNVWTVPGSPSTGRSSVRSTDRGCASSWASPTPTRSTRRTVLPTRSISCGSSTRRPSANVLPPPVFHPAVRASCRRLTWTCRCSSSASSRCTGRCARVAVRPGTRLRVGITPSHSCQQWPRGFGSVGRRDRIRAPRPADRDKVIVDAIPSQASHAFAQRARSGCLIVLLVNQHGAHHRLPRFAMQAQARLGSEPAAADTAFA